MRSATATAAPPRSAGYSGKSLPDKLGFKPGMAAAFIALPPRLDALASSVAFSSVARASGWAALDYRSAGYDVIHAFATNKAELADGLPAFQNAIKRDGMIWLSWPKKASGIATDLSDQAVRGEALKLDLVDVKVAAVDDVWSALKLVIRKDRRSNSSD